MIKKYLSFTLICLLLATANVSLVSAQTKTDSANDKIKAKIIKRGTGENKRVEVETKDGKKLKGYVSDTSEESFTVTDPETRQATVVAYPDVAKVKNTSSKSGKIALIVAGSAAAAAAIVLIIFVSKRCQNEGGC